MLSGDRWVTEVTVSKWLYKIFGAVLAAAVGKSVGGGQYAAELDKVRIAQGATTRQEHDGVAVWVLLDFPTVGKVREVPTFYPFPRWERAEIYQLKS